MRLALALIVLASPCAATPYEGTYRPDAPWAEGWNCSDVGSDGGALAVQGDTFYGVESACTLTNPVDVRGMKATLYDLECSGEGETWTERLMLMETENGIAFIKDRVVSPLLRCE